LLECIFCALTLSEDLPCNLFLKLAVIYKEYHSLIINTKFKIEEIKSGCVCEIIYKLNVIRI